MSLLGNPVAELWLAQFSNADERALAREMLAAFTIVSHDDLARELGGALRAMDDGNGIAIFIEREIPKRWIKGRNGIRILLPVTMYREERIKIGRGRPARLRAVGAAKAPVDARRRDRQNIGSEGPVAAIASGAANRKGSSLFVHPSAQIIRDLQIRKILILTDFIGSGKRITENLDSLWRLRSVKSWSSGGRVRFQVLAYSGTKQGVKRVQQHRCAPSVQVLHPCPTIESSFRGQRRDDIKQLCFDRSPDLKEPYGYEDVGALIAFGHSCPNNVPAIFTKGNDSQAAHWCALFPRRDTFSVMSEVGRLTKHQRNDLALETLKFSTIAAAPAFQKSNAAKKSMIVALAAFRRGHRHISELATRTMLSLPEIQEAMQSAVSGGYLDGNHRVTQQGNALLRKLNDPPTITRPVAAKNLSYYPKSLRIPVK